MPRRQKSNLPALALSGVLIAAASAFVVYSPTLYQMFCNLTGYGGTVQRAVAEEASAASSDAGTVTVFFDANVAPGLPWDFRPETRKVVARLGEPTKVNYLATNHSEETIVARATFNVTPFQAAPYFFKIQCFCFTDEKLAPGESAVMPVVLFVDDEIAKNPDTADVHEMTLSYTFFRQENLSPGEVAEARDLKEGSAEVDARIGKATSLGFDNDAPRR